MQSPIPVGTLLQNHYRVVQLLGQGGFGRTYLAEDQGRFNERCAIKEFVPIKGEDHFSDKATQLFQREASVLYQISHPQIPKFRATFEEGERLFLVQDYVDGPTFHEVLNQRRQQGRAFSEGEIRQFLKQLLPVLAHIHARGIIHRDISPDNIILRQQDQLPVLIDFGVVKEVVTRIQLEGEPSPATTVGKAGYAPSEQMQTGRAYPSSDLYALAVTAIVLLSGKEPQVLFDDVNFAWRWQEAVQVTPAFAQVLNKALNFKPGDRFQSVSEMAKALSASEIPSAVSAAHSVIPNNTIPKDATPRPSLSSTPPPSQMRTVAVGRANPDVTRTASQANTQLNRQTTARQNQPPDPRGRMVMPSEQDRPSLLENPFAVGGLAAGLAAIAGFGGWAVVQGLGPPSGPTPTITSLPPLTSEEPTPSPTPTQVSPKPVEYQQPQLALTPGVTKVVEGSVRGSDTVNYPLAAEAGQSLSVSVEQESMLLSVLKPNGRPVRRNANRVRRWEGELEEAGEYQIQLKPVQGVPSSDYRLEVTLGERPAPVVPDPVETTEPDPVETPDPAEGSGSDEGTVPPADSPSEDDTQRPTDEPIQLDIRSQRVSFPSGAEFINVANNVAPGPVKRYVVNAQGGQILTVRVISSDRPVSFSLLLPSGDLLADAANLQTWQGFLPQGGDYSIDVVGDQLAEFTLEIGATASIPSE